VSYKAHVDATIPASVSALTASTPVERDMDRERDKSRSPLSQRVVTESLSAFDTDLVRAVERLQGDVLERNNEIYRFQRLLQDKNLKIAEQGALIQGHERELKAKQEIVQSQQALIHTQQNMISRMQMLTIG
jgi:hypothetical protein